MKIVKEKDAKSRNLKENELCENRISTIHEAYNMENQTIENLVSSSSIRVTKIEEIKDNQSLKSNSFILKDDNKDNISHMSNMNNINNNSLLYKEINSIKRIKHGNFISLNFNTNDENLPSEKTSNMNKRIIPMTERRQKNDKNESRNDYKQNSSIRTSRVIDEVTNNVNRIENEIFRTMKNKNKQSSSKTNNKPGLYSNPRKTHKENLLDKTMNSQYNIDEDMRFSKTSDFNDVFDTYHTDEVKYMNGHPKEVDILLRAQNFNNKINSYDKKEKVKKDTGFWGSFKKMFSIFNCNSRNDVQDS